MFSLQFRFFGSNTYWFNMLVSVALWYLQRLARQRDACLMHSVLPSHSVASLPPHHTTRKNARKVFAADLQTVVMGVLPKIRNRREAQGDFTPPSAWHPRLLSLALFVHVWLCYLTKWLRQICSLNFECRWISLLVSHGLLDGTWWKCKKYMQL